MQREMKGIFYYLFINTRYLFLVFWAILISLVSVSILLNVFIFKEGVIVSQLSFPLYLVCGVIGVQMASNNLPYLIKMGSTRKGIFKCVGVHFFTIAFVNAILVNVFYSLSVWLFSDRHQHLFTFSMYESDEEIVSLHHFADLIGNDWLSRFVVDLSIMFFLLVCGFLIGLIFYKFGTVAGIGFLAFIIFLFIFGIAQGWLIYIIKNVFQNLNLISFIKMIIISVIIYLTSYLLLRRLSIKD